MYEISLTREASEVYEKADAPLARKINHAIDQLREEPHIHPNITRLTGELRGLCRHRIGDWRIVYRIEEERRLVVITLIVHRSRAYR